MDLRLTDKVAIVTGSSRGIGKAIAAGLAAEGCRVILCARDADVLEQSAAELRRTGAKVLAVTADLSRPEDPARVIEEAVRAFGRVDILCSERASWVTGACLNVDGGQSRSNI
jgi:3-oxoacyl-[acyl-carrier protein] reductase